MATTVEAFAERIGRAEHYPREWLEQPLFLHQLCQDYLPQIPNLHARLGRDGARVADIGCGVGWSTIAIARAYPGVTVDGFDLDAPSIDVARRNATEAGVADRVHFAVADTTSVEPDRPYDAVLAFECLHDMPDPVGVLAAMRRLAASGGIVIVMDERTDDSLHRPRLTDRAAVVRLPECASALPFKARVKTR